MEDGKREESEEFEAACQVLDEVTGKLIGRVAHGVELSQLADPKGGGIEETERRITCIKLLAKLPPREVGQILLLAQDPSNKAAAARYRIRVKLRKLLGIRRLDDII